eukprot:TRINITY_DN760_c0_g2_i6.p1 TRINITY_DN760_c0_g2~~TRINITY_DN760_c0_g2_i6.p1  ORF type:complete len:110 (+),score=23.85 TRINITY_DN760_c0_g2_i6:308-637(+)
MTNQKKKQKIISRVWSGETNEPQASDGRLPEVTTEAELVETLDSSIETVATTLADLLVQVRHSSEQLLVLAAAVEEHAEFVGAWSAFFDRARQFPVSPVAAATRSVPRT